MGTCTGVKQSQGDTRMKSRIIGIIFTLLVLWIGLIFYFSSQPSQNSYAQSGMVITAVKKLDDLFDISHTKIYKSLESLLRDKLFRGRYQSTSAFVRKSAHFGIYFILGIMSSMFGYLYTKKLLITFLLGSSLPILIAVLDELNQSFVGRTSSLEDVILDGAGALMGTILVILIILMVKTITHIYKN